jgi:hypothetical protein
MESPQVPFFVAWDCEDTEHPSAGGANSGISISAIEIAGDPQAVVPILDPGHLLEDIEMRWVDGDEPGVSAVTFSTPAGSVRID